MSGPACAISAAPSIPRRFGGLALPRFGAPTIQRWLFLLSLFVLLAAQAASAPLRVCCISGSFEYESDKSLKAFQQYLEAGYNAACTLVSAPDPDHLGDLSPLSQCDVALFFTRRLTLDGPQLERVKQYCLSGKPIVGVRTASHGFQKWLEFDRLVLGGNYHNHFPAGYTQKDVIDPGAKDDPVLEGIGAITSRASLYKSGPLAPDTHLLLTGSTPEGSAPVAWTREINGGRVFYTSLGAQGDFENGTFRRLLANALFWVARRQVERKPLPPVPERPMPTGMLKLRLRTRVETFKGSGAWDAVTMTREVPVAETAIVICDMWDNHWCQGAAQRCAVLAGKMEPVLEAARAKGVQIIHCPSETMDFYLDSLQRRRMQLVARVEPPPPLALPDPPLPIDDSDGGCDSAEKPWYMAWTREHAAIQIGEFDGISDQGAEVYSFLRAHGIQFIIVMGVHANMCVLNRPFAIKQMTRWGVHCILARDLTDAMYNPRMPPHVSHWQGVELVVEYIEKYWAPSVSTEDLLAGLPQ
ncbi:MAG: isochorismatase family protein [Verrucomicrobia bacterium]|nr:isochorismatase family protein [Verrucomicrobiota bacterium]